MLINLLMKVFQTSDTQPLLMGHNKQPKKSTKTKRAPKAPAIQKAQDLDAIMPYEEPIKHLPDNDKNENVNTYNEIAEIKPKTFSGLPPLVTLWSPSDKSFVSRQNQHLHEQRTETNNGRNQTGNEREHN